MRFDSYYLTWEIARGRIAELTRGLGLNSGVMSIQYNRRPFDSPRNAHFMLDERAKESANFL
jgi:hypothetical protein